MSIKSLWLGIFKSEKDTFTPIDWDKFDGQMIQEEPKKRYDTQRALDYINANPLSWFTPEEIKNQLGLRIGVPALARRLREYRSKNMVVSRIRQGKNYVEYASVMEDIECHR
jgi:hypothetical protein